MSNQRTVAILIPAYNEAKHIREVIRSLPEEISVAKQHFAVRVIVVDDCSRDDTYVQAKKENVTVLRHIMNSGAGAAVRTGLHYAERMIEGLAYVVTIDGDGQHFSGDVERMVRCAVEHNVDMVVGNRLHEGNKATMPVHRSLGNWGLSLISRILFGVRVKDSQSGLRLFAAPLVPFVADSTIDRYGSNTELLWLAQRNGARIQEIPISVKYSDETIANGQNNWGVVELLLDLLWIRISR
jgi:glycosyltransferase involved in cell wall biosynthesis